MLRFAGRPSSTSIAGLHFGQDERKHLPLRRHKLERLRVARVHNGKRLKRAARFADADDLGDVVVHLEPLADPRLLARPEQLIAFEVHDHGVGFPQVEQVAQDHVRRCADKRRIIQAQQNRLLEVAVGQARTREAFVKANGPRNALDAANAVQIVFRERLDVVGKLNVAIHHPDARALDVANLSARLQHQPAKDRRLLRDQQRRERDTQDDAQVFAAIAGQHFERDPTHRTAPLRSLRAGRPIDASEKSKMCCASFAMSSSEYSFGAEQIANDRIGKMIEQTLADDAERREPQLLVAYIRWKQFAKNREQNFKLRANRRLNQFRAGGGGIAPSRASRVSCARYPPGQCGRGE